MNTTFWFKSSYSTEKGDACVEVAVLPERIGIRDSKDPAPRLAIPAPAWTAFIAELRNS